MHPLEDKLISLLASASRLLLFFTALPSLGQYYYELPLPDHFPPSFDVAIANSSNLVVSLKASINGCATFSYGAGQDTIISLHGGIPQRFHFPWAPYYKEDFDYRNTALLPLKIHSTVPVNVAFYHNLAAPLDTQIFVDARQQRSFCFMKTPSEACELQPESLRMDEVKYSDVHPLSFEKDMTTLWFGGGDFEKRARGLRAIRKVAAFSFDDSGKYTMLSDSTQHLKGLRWAVWLPLGDSCYKFVGRFATSDTMLRFGNIPFYGTAKYNQVQTDMFSFQDGRLLDIRKYQNHPTNYYSKELPRGYILLYAHNQTDEMLDKFQYMEQVMPREKSAKKVYLPILKGLDSALVAVLFWEDNTYLSLNGGDSLGPFKADTVFRYHLDQSTVLSANKPIQVQAGTFSAENTWDSVHGYHDLFNGNYTGVGYRPDAPKDYITHSIFQPFLPPDSSAAAFLHLTCRTEAIATMQVNGKPVTAGLFSPYSGDSNYSHADLALHPDSIYRIRNPAGFLGIHYSKAVKRGGFVRTYAATLSQTPLVDPSDFGEIQYRKKGDTAWLNFDTLSYCSETPIEVRLPQYRHTTWLVRRNDGSDTIIRVGSNSPKILNLRVLPQGQTSQMVVRDSASCVRGDTLFTQNRPLRVGKPEAALSLECEGVMLRASLPAGNANSYRWQVNGRPLERDSNAIRMLLRQEDLEQPSLRYEVALSTKVCEGKVAGIIGLQELREQLLPNFFTPNGDGINDCFAPPGAQGQNCVRTQVYNRYGREVWRSSDSPSGCWDGTYRGRPLPDGVYYYTIRLQEEQYRGFVHLMR